jgi:hypothetical protein
MQMLPDGSLVPNTAYTPGTVADFGIPAVEDVGPLSPPTTTLARYDGTSSVASERGVYDLGQALTQILAANQGDRARANANALQPTTRPTGTYDVLQGIRDLINSPGLPRPAGTVNVLEGLPSVIPTAPRTRSPDAIDAMLSALNSPGTTRPTGTYDVLQGLRELFQERSRPTGTYDVLQGLRELFRERGRPNGTVNVLSAFQ